MKDSDDQNGLSWLVFEWDEVKAQANADKHGVEFEISASGRLLIAAHTEDEEVIRLITCRTATRKERRTYEERR